MVIAIKEVPSLKAFFLVIFSVCLFTQVLILNFNKNPFLPSVNRFFSLVTSDCSDTNERPLPCIQPFPTDFDTLMKGQGRNLADLAPTKEAFIERVINNASSRFTKIPRDRSNYQLFIGSIYTTAVSKNINPLMILTLWGTEQNFSLDIDKITYAFSCPPASSVIDSSELGFYNQLDCAVDSFANYFREFDRLRLESGLPVTIPDRYIPKGVKARICQYMDATLYGFEIYGPICRFDDSNENFHANFYSIYKELLGGALY